MPAPLGAILAGILPGAPSTPLDIRLDTGTMVDTAAFADFDVTANDPTAGVISNPVLTSGPTGTVSVAANQIRLVPSAAGIYVIGYTASLGALSSIGILTVVVTTAVVGGTPPGFQLMTSNIETAGGGVNPINVAVPALPANTRGLIFHVSTWLAFGATEPQTITTLNPTYDGVPMTTRLDTFGNQVFRGEVDVPTDTGPGAYAFLLRTPTDTINLAGGNLQYTTEFSAGNPEVRLSSVIAVTHPDRDLAFSEIGGPVRATGGELTSAVTAVAPDNTLAISYTSVKRNPSPPAVTGDAAWTQTALLDSGGTAATDGKALVETRTFATGGAADHTTTFDNIALHGSVTIGASDIAGAGGTIPTVEALALQVSPGGPVVSFDPQAGNGGTTPLETTSVAKTSADSPGDAVVTLNGDLFDVTPPTVAGTSEFEFVLANAFGTTKSTLMVTASSFATGPQSGLAAGLGLGGESLAQINAFVNDTVNNTIRPQLVTLNQSFHAQGEAAITAANPDFVELTATNGAGLVAAINGGNRKLFLRANTTYNWSDLADNQLTPAAGLEIIGLPGNDVIVGGGNKSVGNRRWLIRGNLEVTGVNFRDGAIPYSLIGLATTVNTVSVTNCTTNNIGALLHHELPTGVSANLRVENLTFSRNICQNVRDGMNLRMGVGGNNAVGRIINMTIEDNIVDNWQRYGLTAHFDNPIPIASYTNNSFAVWRRNLVQNSTTITGNGFAISAGCMLDHLCEDNWVVNNSRGGTGFDTEAFYTKAITGTWRNNVVWNSGECDFQGVISGKGEPGLLNTGLAEEELGELLIEHNFVGSSLADVDNLCWNQRSNMNFRKNTFVCGGETRVLAGQSASPYRDMQFDENFTRIMGTNTNAGIQVFGDWQDFSFSDNEWRIESNTNTSIYRIVSDNGNTARTIDRPSISGDQFIRTSTSFVTAIAFEPRVSNITNPSVTSCHFNNIGRALNIATSGAGTGTVVGVLAWTGHTHENGAPTVNNSIGTNIQTLGGGGGNSF